MMSFQSLAKTLSARPDKHEMLQLQPSGGAGRRLAMERPGRSRPVAGVCLSHCVTAFKLVCSAAEGEA
jgi:hypothetical protein